jgi:hypothetical protein
MLATGLLLHLLRWAQPRLGEVMVTIPDYEMLWGWFNHHIWYSRDCLSYHIYLVGGLEHGFHFSIYWECHQPN